MEETGNTLLIDAENEQLSVTLCSPRTLRIRYSADGDDGYSCDVYVLDYGWRGDVTVDWIKFG